MAHDVVSLPDRKFWNYFKHFAALVSVIQPGLMLPKVICYDPTFLSVRSVALRNIKQCLGLFFGGWFLIIGDSCVPILWTGKQTAERRDGKHCCFSSHCGLLSLTVFHGQEEKESGWTGMVYQGAICMSA